MVPIWRATAQHPCGLTGIGSERFFTQYMLAGPQGLHHDVIMERRRDGHYHRRDIFIIDELLPPNLGRADAMRPGDLCRFLAVLPRDCRHFDSGDGAESRHVHPGTESGTDNAHGECRHTRYNE